MPFIAHYRRLIITSVTLVILGATFLVVRPWLGGYVIRAVLGMTGATGIKFQTVQATPWHVTVEDIEFRLNAQLLAARRLTLEREHWWMLSLGDVRVEGAKFSFTVDGSDVNPWAWNTYEAGRESVDPASLPVKSLDLDGEIVVSAANQPDQHLQVKLESTPQGKSAWIGNLVITGAGFNFAGAGTLLDWGSALDFQVHSADLDLAVWQGFIQRLMALPGAPWELGGKLTGVAEGHVTAKRFAATARVNLRNGRMRVGTRDVVAEGAEADLEFSDLWKLRTKSGKLRLAELHVGRLPLSDVTADFALSGGQAVAVETAAFSLLGGRGELGPFRYFLNQREVAAALTVSGIDVRRLLPLTTGVGAVVTGRLEGALPLRIQEWGVRIDPGFLTLQAGPVAEFECNATSLLRSGALVPEESLEVLKEAGDGAVNLKLTGLRLDIRPKDIPLGCSARVHVAGMSPAGPVTFDFNVNGAIEKYLELRTGRR